MNVTAEDLEARSKEFGMPIAKNHFEGTVDDPVPPLPYLVYLMPHETGMGADEKNNLREQEFDLELYTAEDGIERRQLMERIEEKIFPDVEYEKYTAYIKDEECFQTAYEVRGLLKKVKGANRA